MVEDTNRRTKNKNRTFSGPCWVRNGGLLNQSGLAKELGHTRQTVDRYPGLLERLFLVRRLPAWHRSRRRGRGAARCGVPRRMA